MFTELDISVRRCSISAPSNRGCMDRKGKRMQNGWPQADGRSLASSSRAVVAPLGYMHAVGLLRTRMSAESTWKAGNGCCIEMESPSFQKNRPYNPRGRTLQLTRWVRPRTGVRDGSRL
jgi:hypothetical protein